MRSVLLLLAVGITACVAVGVDIADPTKIAAADLSDNKPHINVKIHNINNIHMAQVDKREHKQVLRTNKILAEKAGAAALDAQNREKEAEQEVYEQKLLSAEKKERASLQESLKKQTALQNLQQTLMARTKNYQADKGHHSKVTTDPDKISEMMKRAEKYTTEMGAYAKGCSNPEAARKAKANVERLLKTIQESIMKAKAQGEKTDGRLQRAEERVLVLFSLGKNFNDLLKKCATRGGIEREREANRGQVKASECFPTLEMQTNVKNAISKHRSLIGQMGTHGQLLLQLVDTAPLCPQGTQSCLQEGTRGAIKKFEQFLPASAKKFVETTMKC